MRNESWTWPLVTLCAGITLDGKLDGSPVWRQTNGYFGPVPCDVGDLALADPATVSLLPELSGWILAADTGAAAVNLVNEWLSPPTGPTLSSLRRIYCLGGAKLFHALLQTRLVNELFLVIRPRIDGRRDSPTLSGPPTPEFFPRSLACRLLRMETRDGECLLHYRVLRRRPKTAPLA